MSKLKNRIQIDGEWYVKETQVPTLAVTIPTKFEGCVVENDNFCFEATRLYKDDGVTFYKGLSIKCTDKRVKPWKDVHWFNDTWMIGILEGNPASVKKLKYMKMEEYDLTFLQSFLQYLVDENWLIKTTI